MRDRPSSLELLREARRLLREELAPKLAGGDRYNALMIANAMGMAERELAAGEAPLRRESELLGELLGRKDSLAGLNAELAARLRSSALAGEARVYAVLMEIAEAKLREVNPKALERD